MVRLCRMGLKAPAGPCSLHSCSIIRGMRAASAALLIVGFGVGFFAMNKYITPHAVEIIETDSQVHSTEGCPLPQHRRPIRLSSASWKTR